MVDIYVRASAARTARTARVLVRLRALHYKKWVFSLFKKFFSLCLTAYNALAILIIKRLYTSNIVLVSYNNLTSN